MMKLCGEYVTHKVYGKGQITDADENCVTVMFSDPGGTKRFMFPGAFGTFLIPLSQDVSQEIQDYKDELARSLSKGIMSPAVEAPLKKVKKPAARKPRQAPVTK